MRICLLLIFFWFGIGNLYAQYFYTIDNGINAVHTQKKNDLEISSSLSSDQSFDFQIAYSPIKHLSVSAGYYNFRPSKNRLFDIRAKSFTYSIGTYYYHSFKNAGRKISSTPSNRWVNIFLRKGKYPNGISSELNLGFSKGSISNMNNPQFMLPPNSIETQYQTIFIKIGVQLDAHKLGFGIHHTSNLISFNKATIVGEFDGLDVVLNSAQNDIRKNIYLPGYSMNVYYRIRSFKIFIDVNTLNTEWRNTVEDILFREVISTIGLRVNLQQVFKPKSKSE